MRDLMHEIQAVPFIPPVSDATNAVITSTIIDLQGCDSITFFILTGVARSTPTRPSRCSSRKACRRIVRRARRWPTSTCCRACAAPRRRPRPRSLSPAHNSVFRLGYIGNMRYVQMTITPAANTGRRVYRRARRQGPSREPAELTTMANVLVTRGFPYAADGIAVVLLAAGTRADIRDELIPGLAAEGWIDPGDWHPTARHAAQASSGPDAGDAAGDEFEPGRRRAGRQTGSEAALRCRSSPSSPRPRRKA